jgi:demethylmenaquinone methyltransferase/2-methoxy-6-polyprenyl-1,4-benzoquinol methylase
MLKKAVSQKRYMRPEPVAADVRRLPFSDVAFDLVTVSFAMRNINLSRDILGETFREFYRVLKPGGRFVNIETSQPRSRLLRRVFHAYVRAAVKPIGSRISGSIPGYAYLASTIPRFYPPEGLVALLRRAGFSEVTWRRLSWGITAIHLAVK